MITVAVYEPTVSIHTTDVDMILSYTEPTLAHCAWTVSTARSIVTHALLGGVSRHPRVQETHAPIARHFM